MKKDKEWLEKEINKTLNIDGGSGERIEGFNKGLEFSLDLIDQLDEPELPVIPQFVADYLDDFKKQNLTLGDALDTHFEDDKQIHTWLYEDGEARNDEVFARAWLYGYTIEKEPEKLYRVKFPNVTKHGNEMYLDKNDGEDVTSIDWSPKDFVENEDSDDYLFTEQEIKAIDPRYWSFAEEVPNE